MEELIKEVDRRGLEITFGVPRTENITEEGTIGLDLYNPKTGRKIRTTVTYDLLNHKDGSVIFEQYFKRLEKK